MAPHSQIERELEKILADVAPQRGVHFTATLRPILLANLERGRIDFYLDHHAQAELHEYVWRVIEYYDRLSPYLRKIQQTKSSEVWEPLLQLLSKWAYRILQRIADLSTNLGQLAAECAATAAGKILTAHFPYDTEFEPWAYVLVRNVCHQQLRHENRDLDPIDDEQIMQIPDLATTDLAQVRELRQELLAAIEQLASVARQQVIVLHYFQGQSLPEIATLLGKTISAIYKLHFDALTELRKIWVNKGYKDE